MKPVSIKTKIADVDVTVEVTRVDPLVVLRFGQLPWKARQHFLEFMKGAEINFRTTQNKRKPSELIITVSDIEYITISLEFGI